mgnify:CR=1 FL=1
MTVSAELFTFMDMKALLLAAFLLPSSALAGDLGIVPVDWTRRATPLDEPQIEGLRRLGFRLEPDGRVLDLELKVLDNDGLEQALRLLDAGERRQRLERLRVLLAAQPQDKPLTGDALRQARSLAYGSHYIAVSRGGTAGALKRLTELDLTSVTAVFDGGAAGRGAPAVTAPETAPTARPYFPYLTMSEQKAGENLRAAAAAQLGMLERGRLILSRLNGKDGKPNLPPILVESLGSAARYDANRRALILDRDLVVAELMRGVRPADREDRRRDLAAPDGMAQALAADPDAARRVIIAQDVLVAHELVHAWQDRRDPLFRQMKRGGLPTALILEYEEEAFVEKNLYLHEKLRQAPGVEVDEAEMADYQSMILGYPAWHEKLFRDYRAQQAASAADFDQLRALQQQRLTEARAIPVSTTDDQRAKAKLLRKLVRGSLTLESAQTAHRDRMTALAGAELRSSSGEYHKVMARHMLELSFNARTEVDRGVKLHHAEQYALASGDAALLEEIRSLIGRKR